MRYCWVCNYRSLHLEPKRIPGCGSEHGSDHRFVRDGVKIHCDIGRHDTCATAPPGYILSPLNLDLPDSVSICEPAEINATGSYISIGEDCDFASYVVINVADSSRLCVGKSVEIERANIQIGDRVCLGTGVKVFGGTKIKSRVRVGAGTVLKAASVGNNVKIGANCTIVRSFIGDNAAIESGTVLIDQTVQESGYASMGRAIITR